MSRSPAATTVRRDEGLIRAELCGQQATQVYPDAPWRSVEPALAEQWNDLRGPSTLSWGEVRTIAHSAWQYATLTQPHVLRDHAPVFPQRQQMATAPR